MKDLIARLYKGTTGRLLRSAMATAVALFLTQWQDNLYFMALGPALQTLGKFLRDKYQGSYNWLPF